MPVEVVSTTSTGIMTKLGPPAGGQLACGARHAEEEKHTLLSISGQVGIWAAAQDGLILSHPAGPLSPLASKGLPAIARLHLLSSA